MNNQTLVDISIDRVDINHLRNIVKMCGKDDLRPALTGVSLIVKDGYAEMCASDGYTLGLLKLDACFSKDIFIAKIISIEAMKSLLKSKAGDIARLVVSEESTSTRVVINNKEVGDYPDVFARYPNYKGVIPRDQVYRTEIFTNAIEAIKFNVKKADSKDILSPTYLDFLEGGKIRISSINPDLDFALMNSGTGYKHISREDPYRQHGFASNNLNKVMNCFGNNWDLLSNTCIMEYTSNDRAYIFKYRNSDKLTVLLMPIEELNQDLANKLSESNGYLFDSLKSI